MTKEKDTKQSLRKKRSPKKEEGAYDMIFSTAQNQLNYLLNADNALDTKAGVAFAFVGALGIFYLESLHRNFISCIELVPILLLGICGYFLIKILQSKDYYTGVDDLFNEESDFFNKNKKEVSLQFVSNYQEAFDLNTKILKKKADNYKEALNWLIASLVVIVLLYII